MIVWFLILAFLLKKKLEIACTFENTYRSCMNCLISVKVHVYSNIGLWSFISPNTLPWYYCKNFVPVSFSVWFLFESFVTVISLERGFSSKLCHHGCVCSFENDHDCFEEPRILYIECGNVLSFAYILRITSTLFGIQLLFCMKAKLMF